LSAFSSAVFVLAILAIETAVHGAYSPAWIFISENYVALLTCNILIAYLLAIYVYIASFSIKHPNDPNGRELAAGGHTDNVIYDWFIGRELNPRINLPIFGEVDIMTWCELRPSMLGWIILDLAFIMQQYRNFGKITISILLTAVAQTIYVLDALYMEPAILTTIDVIKDGFGMMLSFGNLVWVPFTYSIQTKYLATHPVELGWGAIASIVAIQGIGYYIFRASNNEKHRFRVDPCDSRVRHLAYIETGTGSKLLITGWWGMARHINSFGDWLMSWSYVLPTALAGYEICHKKRPQNDISPTDGIYFYDSDIIYVVPGLAKGWGMLFTYFFMLYFAILLIHRERRDDALCRKKYGADWETYCVLVPYRIVPYVY
jgi:delta14-sterol reductase